MNDTGRPSTTVYRREVIRNGLGFGSALALSWSVSQSVLWAILHGILSWIYVIYYLITR